MKPLLIAQQMTDIDEKFILGSMPPPVIPAVKPPRPKLRAGMIALSAVAAALSGVLTIGLIVSLVKMGNLNPFAPPDDTEESTVTSESTETESKTEAATEAEEKSEPAISEQITGESVSRARRRQLLSALKPYVSDGRSKAIDSMMSIADILDMMKTR